MKRNLLIVTLLVVTAAFLFTGCSQKGEETTKAPAKSVNAQLAEGSTLQSILKAGKLRVGLEPGYMPFEMQDKQSRIVGFDVDMAREMASAMGVDLELVPTAWDGIIGSLLTDKFDIIMSGMTITQERNLKVNFAEPYIVVGQTILIRKEIAGDVTSYMDLNDPKYTVTSKLGTTGEQAVKKMIPGPHTKALKRNLKQPWKSSTARPMHSSTTCRTAPSSMHRRVSGNLCSSTSLSHLSLWAGPSRRVIPTS